MAATPSVPDEADRVEQPRPCEHVPKCGLLRKPRYLRVGRVGRLDCEQPLRVDLSCGALEYWACSNHRESKCVPCSWKYRRRLTRLAEAGTRHAGHGHFYLLTLTAPGDRQHAKPSGDLCPCTPVGGVDLGLWNASAAARWNRLRTRLKAQHPATRYLRAVEVQKRGALHLHVIVWSPQLLDPVALRRMAIGYGFGHELDLAPIVPGSRKAAYYVAKYVTKACDQRESVPWRGPVLDRDTGEVRMMHTAAAYRTWSASRDWGITMKQLRAENGARVRRHPDESLALQPIQVVTLQSVAALAPD